MPETTTTTQGQPKNRRAALRAFSHGVKRDFGVMHKENPNASMILWVGFGLAVMGALTFAVKHGVAEVPTGTAALVAIVGGYALMLEAMLLRARDRVRALNERVAALELRLGDARVGVDAA